MAFDFGQFAGALGQSLMSMGSGGGGGQMVGGMQQMAPLDLSFLNALFAKRGPADLLPRFDQQQPERPDPGMQMFMGHQNYLTGGRDGIY